MFHCNNAHIAMFDLRQFADSSCLLILTEHGEHVLLPMWETEEFRVIIGQGGPLANKHNTKCLSFVCQHVYASV